MNSRILGMLTIILLSILVLGGCSQKPTPAEEMYQKLENVVTLENEFEEQQEPLVSLEEKEKTIYDQIISLGMKEYDQIVTLSNEALTLVTEREERIKNEKESIQASKDNFEKIKSTINKLEDDSLKNEANELYTLMENRYDAYDRLYTDYTKAIEYDKELYHLFQKEDLNLDELENQIEKINQIYEKVIKDNDEFNDFTKKYNQAKLTFYKHANLDVEYNDDEQ